MDYGRPELVDRLAADYAAGTLRGAARRRLQALLPAHPRLRQAVADWQARLAPLADQVAPVEPPATVWPRVVAAIGGEPAAPARAGLFGQTGFWRWATGFAATAAVALGVMLASPPPASPPVVIVLNATGANTGLAKTVSFVAGISADGRSVVMRPTADVALTPDQALELWAVPPSGAPRSLGLISNAAASTVRRAAVLQGAAALAVSLEPRGGSPTGAPTGPVLFVGKL